MKNIFLTLLFIFMPFFGESQVLSTELSKYCSSLPNGFSLISTERKENLQKIAAYVQNKIDKKETAELTVICTHNSRRSQLGQVWIQAAALFYGFGTDKIRAFSGGTEATACHPNTVAALRRAGMLVEAPQEISAPVTVANNPPYSVRLSEKSQPFYLFSKKYDDGQNPKKGFCAVLVCSSADESCPLVAGASERVYHGYEDPKRADNSPDESKVYDETCRQIATEMFYMVSILKL